MTKNQLKRLVLATEAYYLLTGAQTDAVTDLLSIKEATKFRDMQMEIALGWLRQAGFDRVPGSVEEIFNIISIPTETTGETTGVLPSERIKRITDKRKTK